MGRKRKEGKRPQRKPPACDTCEVPAGVVATVTMKKLRKASIMIPRMKGLAGHGCHVMIHIYICAYACCKYALTL